MILGLDPGATTGWCVYDPTSRRAIECGEFEGHEYGGTALDRLLRGSGFIELRHVVIERPKGYGPTRPQMVDCGYVAGRLAERVAYQRIYLVEPNVHELTRMEVCKILTAAMHGALHVRNDATAWAALIELHGEQAGRKAQRKKGIEIAPAGPLGIVTGHARAALAVAVAFAISRGDFK